MKEIIATEQIFSPISHGKPIAIRYHYDDGTYADAPVIRDKKITDLPQSLQNAIRNFEAKYKAKR